MCLELRNQKPSTAQITEVIWYFEQYDCYQQMTPCDISVLYVDEVEMKRGQVDVLRIQKGDISPYL